VDTQEKMRTKVQELRANNPRFMIAQFVDRAFNDRMANHRSNMHHTAETWNELRATQMVHAKNDAIHAIKKMDVCRSALRNYWTDGECWCDFLEGNNMNALHEWLFAGEIPQNLVKSYGDWQNAQIEAVKLIEEMTFATIEATAKEWLMCLYLVSISVIPSAFRSEDQHKKKKETVNNTMDQLRRGILGNFEAIEILEFELSWEVSYWN
jgi:hypothetical protein